MKALIAGFVLAVICFMVVGYDTPQVGTGFPRTTLVAATGALIGTAITTLPAGKTFYSIASTGKGTAGGCSRIFIRTNDRNGAFKDSCTILVPVGGDDSDFIYSGIDSMNVTVIAAADTLAIKVR